MKLQIGQYWRLAEYWNEKTTKDGWLNGVLMEFKMNDEWKMLECIFLIDGKLETYWLGIDKDENPYWDEKDRTIGMVHHGEHCLVMKFVD